MPDMNEYTFWKNKIKDSLAILPDNAFKDFVRFSTEVIARTKIESETKTVERGGLWYEELLPSETLLYSVVMATDPLVDEKDRPDGLKNDCDVLNFVTNSNLNRFQIGGDETVGKGIVSVKFFKGGALND